VEVGRVSADTRWTLPAWQRWLAIVLFSAGALILTIRFPPADALGWIAQRLGTTSGVPPLLVAAMFIMAGCMLIGERRMRVLRYISFGLAVYIGLSGVLLITTPV